MKRGAAADEFERCILAGGVALFPSDTVYGLACSADDPHAIQRLYDIKRRPPAKSSAVMFFSLESALAALPAQAPPSSRTRTALRSLMPGGVTVLLANPGRLWPLASAADPDTLGVRVVDVPVLRGVSVAVMQSSANLSGAPDARRLVAVPDEIRRLVDLEVDGGELPGTASTVVDLRDYEADGTWRIVRTGAVAEAEVAAALGHQLHFDPATYPQMIRAEVPCYDELQGALAALSAADGPETPESILELGTGTGETARRLLARFPGAQLVGIDVSPEMLAVARAALPADRAELRVARLQDALPPGPFDLVASALCVHHLEAGEKADLFRRVWRALRPGGRFVLADVVVPQDPSDIRTSLSPGYDKPSRVDEQLRWLAEAGFRARVAWERGDLALFVGEAGVDARGAGIVSRR